MTGAIVLAGGKSERMGQDKAEIAFRGSTMLGHVIKAVQVVAERVIVVASRPDQYLVPGVEVIGDGFPGLGPVGGILTGLEALGPGFHVAVACDMPELQPALLRLLLTRAADNVDAVVPLVEGRIETLCAVYNYTAAAKLGEFLENGGRALHRALEKMCVTTVLEGDWQSVDPEGISFTNLNTLADWSAFTSP